MFLLDTNVLSELMKVEPETAVLAWVDAQPSETLFISAITWSEIELGIARLPDGRRWRGIRAAAEAVFIEFSNRLIPFDDRAARVYGPLVQGRIAAGRPITVEDAQIASIALAYDLGLATRNTRDFAEISGLTLINPWA